MGRIMITNGNNFHPADYHAEVTAEKIIGELETSIISVAPTANPDTIFASRALRKQIEKALLSHHQKVEDGAQADLKAAGDKLETAVVAPEESEGLVDEAGLLEDIRHAAAGTPFAALFERDDVRKAIISELHHETRSQIHVHRLVHLRGLELAKRPH